MAINLRRDLLFCQLIPRMKQPCLTKGELEGVLTSAETYLSLTLPLQRGGNHSQYNDRSRLPRPPQTPTCGKLRFSNFKSGPQGATKGKD